MGGLEKLIVAKPAKCALASISIEDAFSKSLLMQADTHSGSDIDPSAGIRVITQGRPTAHNIRTCVQVSFIVNGYGKR